MADIIQFLVGLRDMFNAHIVFGLGILLTGSYLLGMLSEKVGIPAITGFILAGLMLGPEGLGMVHAEHQPALSSVTEIALAIIALVIGSEFNFRKIRKVGKPVVLITLVQIGATFTAVTLALSALGMQPAAAAIMGAIASATAPAATVAVVRDLKARGSFVDHLYGVVALDDAGCVLLFSAVFAIAGSSLGGTEAHLGQALLHGLGEIAFSLGLGAAAGWLMHLLTRKVNRDNEIFIVSLGIVCLLSAMSNQLGLSPLLSSMTAGMVMANISRKSHRVLSTLEGLSPPLYAAFFAIAGTELTLGVFTEAGVLLLGVAFVISRAAGKYGGVFMGAAIAGSDRLVRRYLGFAMLPQAGVAIGLVLFLQAVPFFQSTDPALQALSHTMVSIVLFSVFINELAGPPVSKFAVVRGATL